MTNPIELPMDHWLPDFERAYIDSLDLPTITLILHTLRQRPDEEKAATVNWVRQTCGFKSSWIIKEMEENRRVDQSGKKPKKPRQRRLAYPRLRKVADLMGVPPWLILRPENNWSMEGLYKRLQTRLDTFDLVTSLPEQLEHDLQQLGLYTLTDNMRSLVYHHIQNAIYICRSAIVRSQDLERALNRSESIQGLINVARDFKGQYRFAVEVSLPTDTGVTIHATIRLVQDIFPEHLSVTHPSINQTWRSGWISMRMTKNEFNLYERNVEHIVKVFSKLFDANAIRFSSDADNYVYLVYSFHSLRRCLLNPDDLSTIAEKLPKIPLNMNLRYSTPFSSVELPVSTLDIDTSFSLDLIQTLKWINLDIPRSRRQSIDGIRDLIQSFTRRSNSIDILVECGYLADGSRLVMHSPSHWTKLGKQDDSLYRCTVSVSTSGNKVIWDFDGKLYSITGLTKKLFKILGFTPDMHLNGNIHWKLVGSNTTLFQEAELRSRITQ